MLLPVSIACHRRTSILHRMPSRSSCCCRRWGDLECVEFDRGIVLAAAAIFQWDHGMGQKLFELSGVLDELDFIRSARIHEGRDQFENGVGDRACRIDVGRAKTFGIVVRQCLDCLGDDVEVKIPESEARTVIKHGKLFLLGLEERHCLFELMHVCSNRGIKVPGLRVKVARLDHDEWAALHILTSSESLALFELGEHEVSELDRQVILAPLHVRLDHLNGRFDAQLSGEQEADELRLVLQ
mmetsp:Transcript_18225/g.54987  ORF Transcript_18225/g.54987 Transcript_18225/m.54987 type:complete len:241 (+) Transcript_18225:777-1499(+)